MDKQTQLIKLENTLKKRNEEIKELKEKLSKADRDYTELLRSHNSLKKKFLYDR